jgi:hypothetical protein
LLDLCKALIGLTFGGKLVEMQKSVGWVRQYVDAKVSQNLETFTISATKLQHYNQQQSY